MFTVQSPANLQQTTSYKVVLPFYVYAALSLLVATVLLFIHSTQFQNHYFQSHILTITHMMALGWGTMIIFGASHQLVPVIIEGKLSSNLYAYLTFFFCGIGIPFIAYGFYHNEFTDTLQCGAVLVNLGVLCYFINVLMSILRSQKKDVHAWYLLGAASWLFSTTFFGMLLVFNFSYSIFSKDSLSYLEIHAHLGIVGWFLLLVLGVGSRLIPMFLISKYTNNKTLWVIFILVNVGLLFFIFVKLFQLNSAYYYISTTLLLAAVLLFVNFCRLARKVRIRKSVDEQVQISLISVVLMILPIIVLSVLLFIFPIENKLTFSMLYGFSIFFGWITAIILGMTFKTLPFIVWNRVYSLRARDGKTPAPKELFNNTIFSFMSILYLTGFVLFGIGIVLKNELFLKIGSASLLVSACLYVVNVGITLFHKPKV